MFAEYEGCPPFCELLPPKQKKAVDLENRPTFPPQHIIISNTVGEGGLTPHIRSVNSTASYQMSEWIQR